MIVDDTDRAWAAGFFDGEGCVSRAGNKKLRPSLSVVQVDREVLDKLARILGGNVRGPYLSPSRSAKGYKPIFSWAVGGDKAVTAMKIMWPYLGSIKSNTFLEILSKWNDTIDMDDDDNL